MPKKSKNDSTSPVVEPTIVFDLLEFVEDLTHYPFDLAKSAFKKLKRFLKKTDMCATALKVLFIIFVLTGIGLTIVAMFTPGWAEGNDKNHRVGIITRSCSDEKNSTACENWFKERPAWEKAVIVFMVLAFIVELAVLVWAIISCLAICCPGLFYPLPALCSLATIFLVIAITIYGVKNKERIGSAPKNNQDWNNVSDVGYSFWMGVSAIIVMAIASVLGFVTSCTSKVMPI